jgi:hypothetical protein
VNLSPFSFIVTLPSSASNTTSVNLSKGLPKIMWSRLS